VKNSRLNFLVAVLFILSLFTALSGVASPQQQPKTPPSATKPAPAKVDEAAEGAKRFAINCGRCHQPPEDISPREAKAVIRHMRVRAMLSAEDERLILKFIAP
jgi:mono/diheme cytochrome c family protein